jgi:Spy/CpxP family protein refolding chaperone
MSSTNLLEVAPVRRSWNPRIAGVLTLALVFLSGVAAGAVAMNIGVVHRSLHQPTFDTPQGKVRYFERMQKELDLTPAQSEQIQSVLNDFWELYHTVLSDGKVRVEQLLTDEQRKKFELMLQQQQLH